MDLPTIDNLYVGLHGSEIFSAVDYVSGYHHMNCPQKHKGNLPLSQLGENFNLRTVPFGLAQASTSFQQLISKALQGLDFTFSDLDDILIYSSMVTAHPGHLYSIHILPMPHTSKRV